MQIAIDGPAGAGKSTVAREIAARLGYKYVDTGAMYRALAVALEEEGIDTTNRAAVAAASQKVDLKVNYRNGEQLVSVGGKDLDTEIRTAKAALGASNVAVVPEVRLKLVELQRQIAADHDVVMDGRDIGSYVLPDATFKFYLTASPRARAQRRQRDLMLLGQKVDVNRIEAEIAERDRQDMERDFAPLKRIPGQIVIDTSTLTQNAAVERILDIIRGRK